MVLVNRRKVARDRRGRIFQERRMLVPEDRPQESMVTQIEISDPQKHELLICVPREQVCQLEHFTPPEGPEPAAFANPTGPGIERLGKQTIEGIEAAGTRQSVTIEAGKIGNDRPLIATREFWYAPKLGVNLLSSRDDPQSGRQEFRLTEVVIGDPDPGYFEPPAAMKILDLRKPEELPAASVPN